VIVEKAPGGSGAFLFMDRVKKKGARQKSPAPSLKNQRNVF